MATLEKSCRRKSKKEKKTKTFVPECDRGGVRHETLREEHNDDPIILPHKESSKIPEVHSDVGAIVTESCINQVLISTEERHDISSNAPPRASTSQEAKKSHRETDDSGKRSDIRTTVVERGVGDLPISVVSQGSKNARDDLSPIETRSLENSSSLNSGPENKSHSKISDATPPLLVSERKNEIASGDGVNCLKSSKSETCILKESTSDDLLVNTLGDKSTGIEGKPILTVAAATQPSAPSCDISVEEDKLVRIRCLEEGSLNSLCALTAFHIALPSESAIRTHPLYVLLCDYLIACSHLDRSLKKHEELTLMTEILQENVWSVTEKEVQESGKCSDQVMLVATYYKCVAVKEKAKLSQLSCTLSSAREALHCEYSHHLFDAEVQRLRVEHFVQVEEEAQAVIPSPEDLRVCVVILFSFLHRQDLNSAFISKVQSWLLRLGKVLLKVAAPSDHLLLLSQLLHCPKGVGKWGTPLVQFRPPPLQAGYHSAMKQCQEFELVMAALPILIGALDALECSPHVNSQQRNKSDDAWVVLDSLGEEEHMNLPDDKDLISFLDQIPLKAMVFHALGLSYVDHSPSLSGVDILKLFALCNYSLKTLGSGLQKYNSRRYPSFFRTIADLVHHLTHLVTDLWDFFKSSKHYHCDPAMQARIEVEFEALFIRACGYLYQCMLHNSGWEMLSQLPYQYLSVDALWHLLAVFHRCGKVNCDGDVTIPPGGNKGWIALINESCSLFDAALLAEPEEDASLLLTTMKNMAISSEDVTFAEAVSFDIFRVGHIKPETRGTELPKVTNGLLVSIFSKHPSLFSVLLGWLNEAPQDVEKGALDLFPHLPIHLWKPSKTDLKILSSWILCHDPQTIKSTLSRTILLALPWRGHSNGESPLPLDITISAAALALDACLIWDGKGRLPSSMWSESAIAVWAWSLINVLNIHPLDRKLSQPWPQGASADYDLLLGVISRGLQESHPLASLLSVLATEQGHTWAIAKDHAFTHLSIVVAHGKHAAAISALYLILPLFIDHCDDLTSCQTFQKLLLSLLYADRSYVKMAKNLIYLEFPGPILLQLGNMIVSHIDKSYRFDASASVFIVMWLKSILQVPNWKNETEALYLLDLIIRSSAIDSNLRGWEEAIAVFSQVTKQNMLHIQPSTGTLSSVMNLLSRGPAPGSPRPFSHMSQSSYSNLPWFVLAALEVEEVHESFVWDQLQKECSRNSSLDNTVKNACKNLGLLPFPAAYLCIYRWARQAVDTPIGHPASLLIWVRFFSICNKLFGFPEKNFNILFEGSSSAALLASIRSKLKESVEWYTQEATSCDDHDTSLWLNHCSRLLQTFSLWLEDGIQAHHSQQYSPMELPKLITYDYGFYWQKAFVDIPQCKNQISAAVKAWDELRRDFRDTIGSLNCDQSSHYLPPLHRIRSRLSSCPDPVPLHFPSHCEPVLKFEYPQIVCGKEAASKAIINCLTPLLECARLNSLHYSEHTALDCAFTELLPNLYQDVWVEFTREVCCVSKATSKDTRNLSCSSPAKIKFKVKESKMCRDVWADMERNLACRKRLITTVLKSVPLEACSSGVLLETMARELVSEKKKNVVLNIQETAFCALSHLLRALSEETVMHCLPVKKLVMSCIEILVHEFVLGNEKHFLELLSQMMENHALSGILSPLLTPGDLSTNGLLQAYGILIKRLPDLDKNLAFVLLSKFKINNWLSQQLPLKQERLSLVKLLANGIACCCSDTDDSEWTLVIGILQKHFRMVVIHKFPEVLVEVMELILISVSDHHLPPFIWYELLEAIISTGCLNQSSTTQLPTQKINGSSDKWSLLVKEFSMVQNTLSLMQVKDAVTLFSTFFRRERLQFGLHGIYPKYRAHIEPIGKFLELLGCSLLAMNLREKRDLASAGSPDSIWLFIRDLYSPWLLPYWEDELTGSECTVWIMELMNGHPPLTPWITPDSPLAKTIASSFIRCLQFMIEIAPGHQNSLGFIWEMYCSAFARMGVGRHVLTIIHTSLLQLPWDRFWPTVKNLKDMVEVAESSSVECICFLRTIVSKVKWKKWTDSLSTSVTLSSQSLTCFLRVLLLISGNFYSCKALDCNLLSTLVEAEAISWHNLSDSEYSVLLDLYLSRADPKVVLSWKNLGNDEDEGIALLKLLGSAGGLPEPITSKYLLTKSISFLNTIVQLLSAIIESDQNNVPSEKSETAMLWLLHDMERLVTSGYAEEEEGQMDKMEDVVKQVLIPVLPKASPKFIKSISQVLAPKSPTQHSHQPPTLCAKGILLALQSTSHSPIQLGLLIESAIETCLIDSVNSSSLMETVHKLLLNGGENMVVIGNSLSSAGYLLTLIAYLHSTCSSGINSKNSNLEEYLHLLVHRWIPTITVSDDIEAKIPLLWSHSLILSHKLTKMCPKENSSSPLEDLSVLAYSLLALGDRNEGMVSTLLGAVGLKRKPSPSIRFRVMCLAFSSFVFACLDRDGVHKSQFKEASVGLDNLCCRYKEFREVAAITSSVTNNLAGHSFLEGTELLSKLFSRLYPEKPGYLKCIK